MLLSLFPFPADARLNLNKVQNCGKLPYTSVGTTSPNHSFMLIILSALVELLSGRV